jgi:hypothetical protein
MGLLQAEESDWPNFSANEYRLEKPPSEINAYKVFRFTQTAEHEGGITIAHPLTYLESVEKLAPTIWKLWLLMSTQDNFLWRWF